MFFQPKQVPAPSTSIHHLHCWTSIIRLRLAGKWKGSSAPIEIPLQDPTFRHTKSFHPTRRFCFKTSSVFMSNRDVYLFLHQERGRDTKNRRHQLTGWRRRRPSQLMGPRQHPPMPGALARAMRSRAMAAPARTSTRGC